MQGGIVGNFNLVPRLREVNTPQLIASDGVNNPIDLGTVDLINVRGQVRYQFAPSDSGFTWSINVVGGFGKCQGTHTQDTYYTPLTVSPNTVSIDTPAKNIIRMTTPAADAGGRVYELVFSPVLSVGPTFILLAGTALGTADITVTSTKYLNIQGF